MILRRFRSDDIGTFGTMEVNGKVYFTVEKPWLDNQPFQSCVPDGEYTLVPHGHYKMDGNVLALVGDTVSHYQDPDFKRYACLIHTANYPADVVGCVGLGEDYSAENNMVTNSRESIKEFYAIISPNDTHKLTIETAEYLKD